MGRLGAWGWAVSLCGSHSEAEPGCCCLPAALAPTLRWRPRGPRGPTCISASSCCAPAAEWRFPTRGRDAVPGASRSWGWEATGPRARAAPRRQQRQQRQEQQGHESWRVAGSSPPRCRPALPYGPHGRDVPGTPTLPATPPPRECGRSSLHPGGKATGVQGSVGGVCARRGTSGGPAASWARRASSALRLVAEGTEHSDQVTPRRIRLCPGSHQNQGSRALGPSLPRL